MTITTEQFQMALATYFEQEIAQKATGWRKFAAYFVMASYEKKIPDLLRSLSASGLDFMTPEGNINIDRLYNHSKTAIQKSGQFVLWDIIFTENDIDTLYHIIERQHG